MVTEESEQPKSVWQKTKTNSKAGFDRLWKAADKLGAPVNRLSNKLGSEAFWPTTLDKEADKAARILRSFCKDGFYQEEMVKSTEGPKQKQKVLKKIPEEVIKNCKGLAIFTTMRTGLWVSGAGGSGILIARKEDGTWSPPSGILLHTAGLGFLVGVDIYDCVLVLNTKQAVEAFARWRCTLGGEITATAGPVGVGGVADSEVHRRQYPIFTYLKSRGFYAGVQIDGTVIIERTDENERFYHERISAMDIVGGKARHPPNSGQLRGLMETLKAAQGDSKVAEEFLPTAPPPADYEVVEDGYVFGVPDQEDPDPYGVLALEKEGIAIKEAGTKNRASQDEFEFNPRFSSPIYNNYRASLDKDSPRSPRESWRRSDLSLNKRTSQLSEMEKRSSTLTALDKRSPGLDSGPNTGLSSPVRKMPPPPLPPRAEPTPVLASNDDEKSPHLPENKTELEDRASLTGQDTNPSAIVAAATALTGGAIIMDDNDDKSADKTDHEPVTEPELAKERTDDDTTPKPAASGEEPEAAPQIGHHHSLSLDQHENVDGPHDGKVADTGSEDNYKGADVASHATSTPKDNVSRSSSTQRNSTQNTEREVTKHESKHKSDEDDDEEDDDDDDEFDDAEEEAYFGEVQQVHTAAPQQVISKASVVEVPKRGPPPLLPPRNPNRQTSSTNVNENGVSQESDTSAERTSSSSLENRAAEQESISPVSSTDREPSATSQKTAQSHEHKEEASPATPVGSEQPSQRAEETPKEVAVESKEAERDVPRVSLANIRADMGSDDDEEEYDDEPRGRTKSRDIYV